MQQQYQVNQQQQLLIQQQDQTIGQLQYDVQDLERRQAEGLLVAPTGKGSWFDRPSSKYSFRNTSRYFTQSKNLRR